MLNEKAEKIFKLKYAKENETWEQACWRISKYVASAEETQELREKYENIFFNLIYNKVFIPGGRILANAGTNVTSLLNCFVLPLEDSREGIYQTLKDAAEVFAYGGGIGYNASNLREEGALISLTGGKASGPISFLSLFDQTGEVISQASRRGAQIAFLDIDHPDIESFINYKSTPNSRNKRLLEEYKRNLKEAGLKDDGRAYFKVLEKTLQDDQLAHFNVSVAVTDSFMNAVENNEDFDLISRKSKSPVKTIKARKLLRQVAEMAWESGDPGIAFLDTTNKSNLVPYLGKLEASNPCVTGDTKILTVYGGAKTFKELAVLGEDVLVYAWNPETKLPVVRTMRNPRKTRENVKLLEVEFDSGLKVKCTEDHNFYAYRGYKIEAKNLKIGQAVRAFSTSVPKRDGHMRVHAWVDGKAKHQYTARLVWECYYGKIEDKNLILHHKDFNKLNNKITNLELVTNSEHNRIHFNDRVRKAVFRKRNHKVVSVKDAGYGDVYNGTVDDVHNYIIVDPEPVSGNCSGIVSANCGEQYLLPHEACCLGSLNLLAFYDQSSNSINTEFLEFAVRNSVRFLDNVQTLSTLPIEEINYWTKGLRRLGLGVMGFADLLAKIEQPYNSEDAILTAKYLSWFISYFATLESMVLAKERGVFPLYEKDKVNLDHVKNIINTISPIKFSDEEIRENGFRNVAVTSIAPTGTIALLAGVNSGIEPFFALAYKRNITNGIGNTAKDFIIEMNPILFEKLKELNFDEEKLEEVKKKISRTGSIQNISEIPDTLKAVFRNSHEISPEEHVDMQAAWQIYVDNSISKTINLPQDATVKDIENILMYMWKKELKGGTIYRDKSKSFQILNVGK